MRGRLVALAVVAVATACDATPPTPSTAGPASTVAPEGTPGTATPATGSRVDDPAGDVTDPEGAPPPTPVPAADLTGVALAAGADGLTVTFELAGAPTDDIASLLWSVRSDEDVQISAQQIGPELYGAIYDPRDGTQTPLEVRVDGATVSVTAPRSVARGARWQALAQLDGAYEDTTASLPAPAGADG